MDLSGLDLHAVNLEGTDLSDANLSGANLAGADLSGANLVGANVTAEQLELATSIKRATIAAGTRLEATMEEIRERVRQSAGQHDDGDL